MRRILIHFHIFLQKGTSLVGQSCVIVLTWKREEKVPAFVLVSQGTETALYMRNQVGNSHLATLFLSGKSS